MVYEKQEWENLPAKTTPTSAERFAHMETQYDEAVAAVGVFTPQMFGAFVDGVTDDAVAIQAAIDAAAAGGGRVHLPPGDYAIGARVILKANVHVVGHGATIHRLAGLGTMVVNWVPGDITQTGYDGPSNIVVEGVTFDAHGDTQTVNPANVLGFGHCRDIRVVDCEFRRTSGYHALELNAVDGAYVEGCTFSGFAEVGGLTEKEAIQIDCATPGDYGAADNTPAKNVTVTACVFRGYGALPAHHVGVGAHNAGGGFYDNISVTGCVFDGLTATGVWAFWWRGGRVAGNTASVPSGAYGVRCQETQGLAIVDNYVARSGGTAGVQGIAVSNNSKYCRVAGNHVEKINEGIYLGSGTAQNVVSGNTVRETVSYAIVADSSNDALISGNNIWGAGYTAGALSAIRVTGTSSAASVVQNKVRPHGAGTEVSAGVSVGGSATNAWAFGNDFLGLAAAITGTASSTGNRI